MPQLGDFMEKSSARDVELLQNEIAIFKNLIQERAHPLDLVRELLSNAAAREVGATKIEISYTKGRDGHVFEVIDDGCGMTYTGYAQYPGRLDRFLGLGMSAIVGEKADEFSWKGLGSKLAYQSKRVEIETRSDGGSLFSVTVNEPWSSLERNLLPKPRLSEYEDSHEPTGTRIVVTGHPPHRLEEPFTFEEIRAFLLHRTFAGFTRERDKQPSIILSVLGQTEELNFGFPEFRGIEWPDGIALDTSGKRLLVNILVKSPKVDVVRLKGFLTWDANPYALSKSRLNTGLILSSRGIPYFALDLDDYGARGISHANPGVEKTCLVVECDGVHARMNISRSDLVDCPESVELKKAVKKLFERLETSHEYLAFRQIPKRQKQVAAADHIAEEKRTIESEQQNWVVYEAPGQMPVVLMREPKNETEVTGLIWKLETLGALPFEQFQTLGYIGASRGPDMLAHFQENQGDEPLRCAVIEVENNFYSYKAHGHKPSQYPKVLCWDIPQSGRKARLVKTTKKHKFTINADDYQVHVFVLKLMDGIKVLSRQELRDKGVEI